jgi:sulfoxide reductase catalytic subunit YedY
MRFDLANASDSVIVSSMAIPQEYPFESNVNPMAPHPRWSQAFERRIDTGARIRTQPYNGYGNLVAKLYEK